MFVWVLFSVALVCGANAGRIVGGDSTTIENYPSIVQVERYGSETWSQSCAASILNNYYVLSAAHCFVEINDLVESVRRIRAGTSYRNTGGEIYYFARIIPHPSYHDDPSRGYDGDIALGSLSLGLVYNDAVRPIAIPPQYFEVPDDSAVVHAGWGHTSFGGNFSEVLLDVTVNTVNRELCTERYANRLPRPGIVTENMICAGILDVGGKDACQGDSGGPLYYNNVLVGVVSWGGECADAHYPGVSAKVSSYTEWIVERAI